MLLCCPATRAPDVLLIDAKSHADKRDVKLPSIVMVRLPMTFSIGVHEQKEKCGRFYSCGIDLNAYGLLA